MVFLCFVTDSEKSSLISLTKKEIFFAIKQNFSDNYQSCCVLVENKLEKKFKNSYQLSKKDKVGIKPVFATIRKKWQDAKRTTDVFVKYNDQWPNTTFCFIDDVECVAKRTKASTSSEDKRIGCPLLSFKKSSDRTKRRRTEDIREYYNHE